MKDELQEKGDYERWGDDEFWSPKKHGPQAEVLCPCGSVTFRILSTDSYETTGECTQCGMRAVVHSG